jgi:hypothetical protein
MRQEASSEAAHNQTLSGFPALRLTKLLKAISSKKY